MKKSLNRFLVVFSIVFSLLFLPVLAANEISVYLNGEKLIFDVLPENINGRILVPFRGILEALGANVSFVNGNKEFSPYGIALGKTNGKDLIIPIGENFVNINSCSVELDVPAQIVDGRTLVPIRVVSECMGAQVEWNSSTQSVIITSSPEIRRYWNDSCSYYGDVIFTEDSYVANGYGTVYNNEDGSINCQGYFKNDFIIKGSCYYSDGSLYIGEFSDTKFANKHGKGFLYFNDKSILECFWNNDVAEGDFHFYDTEANTHIYGTYLNGEWDGEITFYNLDNGKSNTVLYKSGEKITTDTSVTPSHSTVNNSSIPYCFVTAKYPLYLYSNDGKVYLGKLTTDKYDSDSIFNSYGSYGNKYSRSSIFYEYGAYGSKYSNESAFNEFAINPPIIIDSDGQFIAYLTENKYTVDGITFLELISILRKQYQ